MRHTNQVFYLTRVVLSAGDAKLGKEILDYGNK